MVIDPRMAAVDFFQSGMISSSMSIERTKTVQVSEDVHHRMKMIAESKGATVDEAADEALRQHVDELEQGVIEAAELDRRWQRYQDGAPTIPVEQFRKKLHGLAAQAAAKLEM